MAQTFFPSLIRHSLQHSTGKQIYSSLFPLETARLCPEQSYQLKSTVIRLPYLGVFAIWGVLIGFIGCILLISKVQRISKHDDSSIKQRHNLLHLCLAFFMFGGMNLCGIYIHCLWDAPETSYSISTPIGWALDCYFTGCSGCSLAFLGLCNIMVSLGLSSLFYLYLVVQSMGMVFLLHFLLLGGDTSFLELWYLVPVAFAGLILSLNVAVGSMQICRSQSGTMGALLRISREYYIGVFLLLFGTFLALGGIVFDATLCDIVGSSPLFLDLLTTSTLLFLGCDVVFVGLLMIVLNNPSTGRPMRQGDDDKCKKN